MTKFDHIDLLSFLALSPIKLDGRALKPHDSELGGLFLPPGTHGYPGRVGVVLSKESEDNWHSYLTAR